MSDLHCLACEKPLTNISEAPVVQPDDGLVFNTHGHYGSTVFDPMDGSCIEICICDECLKKATGKGYVYGWQDDE